MKRLLKILMVTVLVVSLISGCGNVTLGGPEFGNSAAELPAGVGVEDIAICAFNQSDVVRHQLVQRIIAAYEKFDHARAEAARAHKKEEKRSKSNG